MRQALFAALFHLGLQPESRLALVSHADPLKALALSLLGEDLDRLHSVELPPGSSMQFTLEVEGDSISAARIIGSITDIRADD
jgi:broad specificity phosphatase PhoE